MSTLRNESHIGSYVRSVKYNEIVSLEQLTVLWYFDTATLSLSLFARIHFTCTLEMKPCTYTKPVKMLCTIEYGKKPYLSLSGCKLSGFDNFDIRSVKAGPPKGMSDWNQCSFISMAISFDIRWVTFWPVFSLNLNDPTD